MYGSENQTAWNNILTGITRILTKSGSPLSYSACDCDSEKMYYNFVQYFEQYS